MRREVDLTVDIQRIDKSIPLPIYETNGSVGFDLCVRDNHKIFPGQIHLMPANVIVKTPPGYMLMIVARSSTPKKYGLVLPHGLGVIDQDYSGNEDEIMIQAYNFTKDPVEIMHGTRLAQGIFLKIGSATWREVENMNAPSRGGFGSTDNRRPI